MNSNELCSSSNPLTGRQQEIVELTAWGASQKEIACKLSISIRTVDNTIRKVKEVLGLNKSTELSAWWFCTKYGISHDLSPLARKQIAIVLLVITLMSCWGDLGDKYRIRYVNLRIRSPKKELVETAA